MTVCLILSKPFLTRVCMRALALLHAEALIRLLSSCRDVQNLGVNLLGHQRKIVSAAQQLRAHLMQGQVEV